MTIFIPKFYFGLSQFLTTTTTIKRTYQGRNIWDDPIIEKSQDQDQGQGQGQDQKVQQRCTEIIQLNYGVFPDIPSLISSLELWSSYEKL